MSDHNERTYPVETRLAILEETVRRVEQRLNQVSDRTHTLVNSVNQNNLLADEAQVQRASMIAKMDKIEHSVDTLDSAVLRNGLSVEHHVAICATRAARLEKLAWALLSAMLATMGFLALQYLSHFATKA